MTQLAKTAKDDPVIEQAHIPTGLELQIINSQGIKPFKNVQNSTLDATATSINNNNKISNHLHVID